MHTADPWHTQVYDNVWHLLDTVDRRYNLANKEQPFDSPRLNLLVQVYVWGLVYPERKPCDNLGVGQ